MLLCCAANTADAEETVAKEIIETKKEAAEPIAELPKSEGIVSVTCPPGVVPGQTLQVKSLDGTRTITTFVPEGIQPGQTFAVEFPSLDQKSVDVAPSEQGVADGLAAAAEEQREEAPSCTSPKSTKSIASKIEDWLTPQPDNLPAAAAASQPPSVVTTTTTTTTATSAAAQAEPRDAPSVAKKGAAAAAVTALGAAAAAVASTLSGDKAEEEAAPEEAATEERALEEAPAAMATDEDAEEDAATDAPAADDAASETQAVDAPEETTDAPEESTAEVAEREAPAAEGGEATKGTQEEALEKSPSLLERLESLLVPKPMLVPTPKAETEEAAASERALSPEETSEESAEEEKKEEEAEEAADDETVDAPEQKFMTVRVPRGMPAGAIMQVEIPNENRALAVTVPPNVKSFHVAYTPSPKKEDPVEEESVAPTPTPPQQQMRGAPVLARARVPQTVTPRAVPPSQKLLLVRVPPGTVPGATLHVSVPDEPGRILAAQVPPGNVPEFHVAYESRAKPVDATAAGMLPPANAYQPQNNKSSFAPLDPSDESFGGYDF